MINHEDQIRDNLASDLSILNLGLTLIAKEQYLPQAKTTKSFIDILARDCDSNYVIIEVKRSNQAAREAIHEVIKYTESIKDRFKLSHGEVKSIIVSTEWEELLVPFSSFVKESTNTVLGFKITIDNDYKIISARKVTPCNISNGRLFSPVQDCNFYENESNLSRGIIDHKEVFKKKGINDFVLVILKAPPFNRLLEIENIKKNITDIEERLWGNDGRSDFLEDFGDNLKEYPYIIYSAFQRLSIDEYFSIVPKESLKYFTKDELSEDDFIIKIESYILNTLLPVFYSDNHEIGYPSKFTSLITSEHSWTLTEIIRSKALSENSLLSDDKIISEIKGETGTNYTTFDDSCDLTHKAKYNEIKRKILETLRYNIVWKNDIKAIFELTDVLQEGTLEVHIFSPNNILLTLIRLADTQDHDAWMPRYVIRVKTKESNKTYLGAIGWNNIVPSFEEIVHKYFKDRPSDILLPMMTVGEREENNFDILLDLGLSYNSHLLLESNGTKKLYRYLNYEFRAIEDITVKNGLLYFIAFSQQFMSELLNAYKTHYKDGVIVF